MKKKVLILENWILKEIDKLTEDDKLCLYENNNFIVVNRDYNKIRPYVIRLLQNRHLIDKKDNLKLLLSMLSIFFILGLFLFLIYINRSIGWQFRQVRQDMWRGKMKHYS